MTKRDLSQKKGVKDCFGSTVIGREVYKKKDFHKKGATGSAFLKQFLF